MICHFRIIVLSSKKSSCRHFHFSTHLLSRIKYFSLPLHKSRKKRGWNLPQYVVAAIASQNQQLSCHVLHLEIRPNYCIYENIINAFGTFQFATTIAEVQMSCLNRYTPICSVGIKKGRAMMAFALLKSFIDFGYVY